MNPPERLSKPLSNPPLVLRMIVVPEGIKVGLYREGKVASYSDVINTPGVPAPVVKFLQAQGKPQEHIYHLAWPEAKELHDAVRAAPSDSLILEASDLESLTRVRQPDDFRLHWAYNAQLKRLERYLINADRHLGKGWFSQGKYLWSMHRALPDEVSQWLSLPYIPAAYLYRFVVEFMSAAENARWPATCDLHIEHGAALKLEMIRMVDHELDVQLTANKPGLAEALDILPGDAENMISGTSLLPGLRPLFSERLLKIVHANAPTHVTGSDLVAFIADDLRPHAAALSVDMRQIDDRYPILQADKLGLRWRITHEVAEAVGRYEATPYVADVPLRTFSTIPAGERFVATVKGWIEITPAFRERLLDWKSQGIARFQISPQELLGLPSARVQMTGLRLPEIALPEASTTLDRLASFLDILRRHGLPGGVSELQADAPPLLVGVCQRLFKENPKAKILWIVGQRARPAVTDALRRAQVAYINADALQRTRFPDLIEGRVTLTSPGEQVELAKSWTLIIFEDLDLLAFSDAQVYFYYQLERQWSLGTFSRADWAQDRRRAQQALHALQLAPENLETFRDRFVRAFPHGSRMRLDRWVSPLRRVFTGNTGIAPAAPPLVPPPVRTPPVVEPPVASEDTPVHRPAPVVPARPSVPLIAAKAVPPKETFVAQARRFANRTEPPTDAVPFNVSWPTYEAMTPEQQQWYFYWRSQARVGNFLPTDTGYLFLNAYEVVNLVGFSSAQDAFTYFVALWRHYRVTVPKLDRYFVDWLADFTAVYPVSTGPLDWYSQAREEGATCGTFDLCVEAWVRSGANVDTLPAEFLYHLADYSPAKTKFYQENNQQGRLDAAYKKGVQAIDQFLRHTDGDSLFDRFRPAEPRPVKREPFAGALYERAREQKREPIRIALASPWSLRDGNALSRNLTSIIKYTENILRRQAKFRSQLQGISLPPEWAAVLDKTFAAPPAPRRQVKIDMSSVDALKRETDEIRRRLIVEDEPAQAPLRVQMLPPINPPVPPAAESTGDLAAVAAIIGDPQGTRARLLRVLRDHQWQADQATLNSAMLPGQFLNVELDYLNESAVETLGDALIFEDNGLYVVAEDYRDEITSLLDAKPHAEIAAPAEEESPAQQADYADMDDNWARFAMRMKPYHWEALAVLLDHTDAQSRLDAIARGVGITSSRLVDDINGFALDSIGDIVIATDREPPYIEDEDIADLQALVAWAQNKALLES